MVDSNGRNSEGRYCMRIRKPCNLITLYADRPHKIVASSPELRLIEFVSCGDTAAAMDLFSEKKLFGDIPCAIDTPYGRFEGLKGVREFAEGWLDVFEAESAYVTPVIQTRANGRVVTELVVNFIVDQEINQVPMFVVGDLRTQNTLDEVRIYCHYSFVPHLQAYREPIFKAEHLEMGNPVLLTGAVREYYEALHIMPAADIKRIMACIAPDCKYGGYAPCDDSHKPATTTTEVRAKFERLVEYIPRCVGIRFETIIDDGTNCVIEWVHVVSKEGQQERARIAMSGIAAYERNAQGLLCGIRICDYAGAERTIDWSKLNITEAEAQKVNFVERFPEGVGNQ